MQQVPERHLDSATQPSFDEFSRRYKVLLHATDVAARRGFPDLLQELSQLLRELFDFNFLNYAIRDDQADLMRVHMVDEELRVPDATGSFEQRVLRGMGLVSATAACNLRFAARYPLPADTGPIRQQGISLARNFADDDGSTPIGNTLLRKSLKSRSTTTKSCTSWSGSRALSDSLSKPLCRWTFQ